MKTGVSFFTFGTDANLLEAAEQSARAGYDGVELVLSENGTLPMSVSDAELSRLRRQINDMGLSVCSVGAWNLWEYNLAGTDKKAAGHAKDIVKKQVDCAAALGADTVLVVPGWVGTNFAPGVVPYEVAYANAQKALGDLAPHAQKAGVHIAIENVWNKFLLSPLEFRNFVDACGSPLVKAYFDVGNVLASGYPDQWIRILGDRISAVHFKDFKRSIADLDGFVDLLEGDVPWDAVMQALKAIKYDGAVTAEMMPPYQHFPEYLLQATSGAMDKILGL